MKRSFYTLSLSALILSTAAIALPPPVPSAGIVERQLEREYEEKPFQLEPDQPSIVIDIPEEKLSLPDGEKVHIESVRIQGNEALSCDELNAVVECYMNGDLSMQDIYGICQAIDIYYCEKGYFLARSYPPEQTIEDDVLVIEVIEGRLGHITVMGNKHYSTHYILRYFSHLLCKPLRYNQFMRAVFLLNENSDLAVGAVLEKGSEFGTADLVLHVKDKRPVHLYLNENNYGRFLTTSSRAGARLDGGNLFTYGDKISIAEVVGFPVDALYFTDVTYTFPINCNGAFFELAYLFSKFTIQEFNPLDLKGRTDIASLKFRQALQRNRFYSSNLYAGFDYKQIQNFSLGERSSFDRLRVLSLGATFDFFRPPCLRNYLDCRLSFGIPSLFDGLAPRNAPDCSTPGAGGRYWIANADYDFLRAFSGNTFVYMHASAQYSPNKLPVAEQIYIGGADTVRGFPLASAIGESGYYWNFEYRFPCPGLNERCFFNSRRTWSEILQFIAFVDNGGVNLQSVGNTFEWGTGLGVRINHIYCFSLSIDWGIPLNHRNLTNDTFTYIKITGQPF